MPLFQDLIEEWVKEYEKFEEETGWNELKFYGTNKSDRTGGQFNFSEKIFAILHQLEKKATITPSIKKLKEFVQVEFNLNLPPRMLDGMPQEGKHEHLLPEVLEIEKDIFCKVSTAQCKNKVPKIIQRVHHRIKVHAT